MTPISVLTLTLAGYLGSRGFRRVRRALREADSLGLVRGIRGLVTAVALTVLAIAVLTSERGLLAFAAVFLAEELYETGVLLLIIRSSAQAGPARATP